jgi:hypothetical protein
LKLKFWTCTVTVASRARPSSASIPRRNRFREVRLARLVADVAGPADDPDRERNRNDSMK